MEEKKNNGTKGAAKWKEVLVGGVSGIALGAAGTLFASSIPLDAAAETADTENAETEDETGNATAQMATSVNDSMSFTAAFNAARAEVGAGGVFEWHGNLYSTFTAEEWNNMDDTARNEFAESIHWDGPSHEYVASNHTHSTHSSHSTQSEEVNQTVNTINTNNTNQNNQSPGREDGESVDVEIIGVEHAQISGHDTIIGTASVNGQAVYYIDVNPGEDDEFEFRITDNNGNQQIDEGEVVDISEQHISVSRFEQLAQANQSNHNNENEQPVQYYANNEELPDYVNDADPGTLA